MATLARCLAALAIAVTALPAWAHKDDPAAALAKITAGRVAGKPQHCIDLPQVTNTQVIDKTTIAYRIGSTYYINTLRSGAEALNDDALMVTKTFGAQLCELDSVQLVDRFAGGLRGFVVLGEFVPYRVAPAQGH
ncbi:hypothetical protein KPL74_09360 [Bacillus sp. NP157]|nr:hypothetical protein KPL74_09360 [Bacillus sp. NP157]